MSHFKARMHQIRFRLELCTRPPQGEPTALFQTPYMDFRDPYSKGRKARYSLTVLKMPLNPNQSKGRERRGRRREVRVVEGRKRIEG